MLDSLFHFWLLIKLSLKSDIKRLKLHRKLNRQIKLKSNLDIMYELLDALDKSNEPLRKIADKAIKTTEGHWNPPGILPPVNIPLEILVGDMTVKVIRRDWAAKSTSALEFHCLSSAEVITGRFQWRYP